MSLTVKITLIIALVLSIVIPFGYYLLGEKRKGRYKTTIATNSFFFFGTMVVAAVMMFGGNDVQAASEVAASGDLATGLGYLAAGIAVASAASAALGAISEDSSVLGKSLIFVGLAEGVALYGLIISFMILGKL